MIQNETFIEQLIKMEKIAWKSFINVIENFGENYLKESYPR